MLIVLGVSVKSLTGFGKIRQRTANRSEGAPRKFREESREFVAYNKVTFLNFRILNVLRFPPKIDEMPVVPLTYYINCSAVNNSSALRGAFSTCAVIAAGTNSVYQLHILLVIF